MIPYVITCIVALLVFIPAFIKIYSLSKLSRLAEKELRTLTLQISLSETFAEYSFWENETRSFLKFYDGRINPRTYAVFKAVITTTLNQRYDRGFSKETKR